MPMVGWSDCFGARTWSVSCTRRTPAAQFLRASRHTRRDCVRDGCGGDARMGERIDEAKGNIKEGVGKLTGDTETQADGRTERDTAKAKREVKGAANKVKGKVEEGLGKVTGDDE